MARPPVTSRFDFSAGDLALDFVNTVGDRPRRQEERLQRWPDVVAWGEAAGLLARRDAADVMRAGQTRPETAARSFAAAIALREHLYGVFGAIASGRVPPADDLDAVNEALRRAMTKRVVVRRGSTFAWSWTNVEPSIERVLYPVLQAAGELLVSGERANVRECASETCSWLFIDRSRTHKRRWCSMQTCGNRDKVRRFYERQRAGRT